MNDIKVIKYTSSVVRCEEYKIIDIDVSELNVSIMKKIDGNVVDSWIYDPSNGNLFYDEQIINSLLNKK